MPEPTEPPPPETAEQEAAEGLSTAEQAALLLFTIGLIEAAQSEDSMSDMDLTRLRRLLMALMKSVGRQVGVIFSADEIQAAVESMLPDLTRFTIDVRRTQSAQPARDPGELSLQREAARALAARAYAMTLSHVLGLVADTVSFGTASLKKVWVTRGDTRVRPLHRRLHGRIKRWDQDFWRWPATDQVLRWPGDPFAPLDATINCRCFCYLSWSATPNIKAIHRPLTT